MATTFTLQNESSAPSYTDQTRSSTTFDLREKAGAGWDYDDPNLTYDAVTDPDSGLPVYYDGMGSATSWTNQNKN